MNLKITLNLTNKYIYVKLGIEIITPSDAEQDEIDKIIFDELVIGFYRQESKERLLQILNNYDVDGVILGCTELPLILSQKDTKIRLLDTVELHVEATLNHHLSIQ